MPGNCIAALAMSPILGSLHLLIERYVVMHFLNKTSKTDANQTTDADLVRAARRGDKRAFVEIVARHQAMVCGIALGILGDFAASEDAAQESFLAAWRKIQDLREPQRLRAWLGQIARHAALGHRRRQRGHETFDEHPGLLDESPAPDEATASEEEAAIVRDALVKLPENYRLPLVLYYREGKSVHAVAEALGISEDAAKQRLARGRDMLRDQMSGLIETVLTRTGPTAVFTMAIAVAIGALAAPAAVAGTVFATSASASGTSTLTAMTTSKTFLVTTALVTAIFIPVGYQVAAHKPPHSATSAVTAIGSPTPSAATNSVPSFESSALFAEWRRLHATYGTTAEAMPDLYQAIADIKDSFRRGAFRSALIAEWAQVDAAGGFEFFLSRRDAAQRRQFFQEWLARDASAAVNALMARSPGWEDIARNSLTEIARKVPSRVVEIIEELPKPTSYWDTTVRDACRIVAEADLKFARTAAEAIARSNPNREQALGGVAQAWGKSDLKAALEWVSTLPEAIQHDGERHDEIIRAALLGKAAVDPVSALDQIGIVPPGGKQGYFATTTGARVLKEAAAADYDSTVAWIAAHPGRLGNEDMMGIANAVTDRLNADPIGFLNRHAADNTLTGIIPAIDSALLNEGGGQRATIWEWLKTQPDNEPTKELRRLVLRTAGWQDPMLAMRLAADLPRTTDGDAQVRELATSIFNGGQGLYRMDKLFEQSPERMRQPLIENAFNYLREDTFDDPQLWISRLNLLPETGRGLGVVKVAQAWAAQTPQEAIDWINSLPTGATHNEAMDAAVSSWAAKDSRGAGEWVATLPAGPERDRSAGALALAIAEKNPSGALDWVMSIADADARQRIAARTAEILAAQNPSAAQQWIEAAPFAPEMKTQLRSSIERTRALPPR